MEQQAKRRKTTAGSPAVEETLIQAKASCEVGSVSFRVDCLAHARTWGSAREAADENDDEEESFTSYSYESMSPSEMFRGKMVSYRGSGSLGTSTVFRFVLTFERPVIEARVNMAGVYFEVDDEHGRERQLEVQRLDGEPEITEHFLAGDELASDHRVHECELRVGFGGPTTAFRLIAHDEAYCIRSRGRIRVSVVDAIPRPNDLATDLGRMLDDETYSDLTLLVSTRAFKVLRAIVCARSPAMRAQLGSGVEADSHEITLHDVEPEPFAAFLRWCYTGQLAKPLDATARHHAQLVLATLALADRYCAASLITLCVDELMSLITETEPNVALHCLQLIYSNPGLATSPSTSWIFSGTIPRASKISSGPPPSP
ncbi:hypothetical protein CTAYLR_000127 [Chrysophaeum taylorii]|uniref:BTB domain-containing protein n=1 Tax=Chrysophaeum taylorii TaxID=2483200 RepID=A0AAD7UIS3_9STRA|nr:hypothetical protein CTAYLR_000127 [Chrysophaeum taylorii]